MPDDPRRLNFTQWPWKFQFRISSSDSSLHVLEQKYTAVEDEMARYRATGYYNPGKGFYVVQSDPINKYNHIYLLTDKRVSTLQIITPHYILLTILFAFGL
jgi:hypothetical protein